MQQQDRNAEGEVFPVEAEEAIEPINLDEVDVEPTPVEVEPIGLIEEAEPDASEEEHSHVTVKPQGFTGLGPGKHEFKRRPDVSGQGAIRCRVFHSRISVESLENMEQRINDWLDGEDVEIKHVGHLVGEMEGKTPRPNVIVIAWY